MNKDDLVERRRRDIERQIALDKNAVNVNFRNRAPEGTGPSNRHGRPKLPVGQHEVKNWPVLDRISPSLVTGLLRLLICSYAWRSKRRI